MLLIIMYIYLQILKYINCNILIYFYFLHVILLIIMYISTNSEIY